MAVITAKIDPRVSTACSQGAISQYLNIHHRGITGESTALINPGKTKVSDKSILNNDAVVTTEINTIIIHRSPSIDGKPH